MSTLTYTHEVRVATAPADANAARKAFWSKLFHAIVASQQRRAEREVARYLASHGHVLNDAAEREITRHLWGGRPL
jgi:hypothetical protein